MKCDLCNDPTKYLHGHWNGEKGWHGRIYDCHNLDCEIKQKKLKDAYLDKETIEKIIKSREQAKNGDVVSPRNI